MFCFGDGLVCGIAFVCTEPAFPFRQRQTYWPSQLVRTLFMSGQLG